MAEWSNTKPEVGMAPSPFEAPLPPLPTQGQHWNGAGSQAEPITLTSSPVRKENPATNNMSGVSPLQENEAPAFQKNLFAPEVDPFQRSQKHPSSAQPTGPPSSTQAGSPNLAPTDTLPNLRNGTTTSGHSASLASVAGQHRMPPSGFFRTGPPPSRAFAAALPRNGDAHAPPGSSASALGPVATVAPLSAFGGDAILGHRAAQAPGQTMGQAYKPPGTGAIGSRTNAHGLPGSADARSLPLRTTAPPPSAVTALTTAPPRLPVTAAHGPNSLRMPRMRSNQEYTLDDRVDNMSALVKNVHDYTTGEVNKMLTAFDTLGQAVGQHITGLTQSFNGLAQYVSAYDTRISGAERSVANHNNTIRGDIFTLRDNDAIFAGRLTGMSGRLDTIDQDVKNFKTTTTSQGEALQKNQSQLSSLVTSHDSLAERVTALENPEYPSEELQQKLLNLKKAHPELAGPDGPISELLSILAHFQRTMGVAFKAIGDQGTNTQQALLDSESSTNGKIDSLVKRVENMENLYAGKGMPASRKREDSPFEDSSDEPLERKRKRSKAVAVPGATTSKASDLSKSTATPPASQNGSVAADNTFRKPGSGGAKIVPSTLPMITAPTSQNKSTAVNDASGKNSAAGAKAPSKTKIVTVPHPAAARKSSTNNDKAHQPTPAGNAAADDDLRAFLRTMDCRKEKDLVMLKHCLKPVREYILYQCDLNESGSTRGKGSLVLRTGGVTASENKVCSRNNFKDMEGQTDEELAQATNLGMVELVKYRNDDDVMLSENKSSATLPQYVVYLGQVFQIWTPANASRPKIESTGYDVYMDVTSRDKALWAIYRCFDSPLPGMKGLCRIKMVAPKVPFYKDFRKINPPHCLCLLGGVSQWLSSNKEPMYKTQRDMKSIESTSMICSPVLVVPRLKEMRKVIADGWDAMDTN